MQSHESVELSTNEVEVLNRLREIAAHGWGRLEITVQDGFIKTIDQHKLYRPDHNRHNNTTPAQD